MSGIRMEVDVAGMEGDVAGMEGDVAGIERDSPSDMGVARAAGVLAVAAGWGHQTSGIPAERIDVLARAPADVADPVLGRWARP